LNLWDFRGVIGGGCKFAENIRRTILSMQFKNIKRKKTVIIAAAVVGLITIVVLSKAVQKKEGEAVQVGKVERRTRLESKVTASGDIRPVNLYNLTAEVPGPRRADLRKRRRPS
jgi:hypothetical protein